MNGKGHRLRKPNGSHLDMAVLSVLTLLQSLVGFPWLCAATVRSINHVKALHDYEAIAVDKTGCGIGESGPLRVVSTREQRISGVMIHALIGGVVVFARDKLRAVPKPALTGLFLYLGQSALKGNQMWERGVELAQDPGLRSALTPWAAAGVPRTTTAAFTLIQFACLLCLIAVKDIEGIGVLFPIVVAALAPLRIHMPRLFGFDEDHLEALDRDTQ